MKAKKIFFTTALLIGTSAITVFSQTNMGINAVGSSPNAAAGLDVDYTNKGVLIPRVALTQSTSNSPIGASIANSLLVYNTATVNDVRPGYYFWNAASSKWETLLTYSTGCNGCTTKDWVLTGVANGTAAGNTWNEAKNSAAGTYYIPAGKEVLAVAFSTCVTEVTAATTNSVAVIEYKGANSNGNWPSGESQVMLDCPSLAYYYKGAHANTATQYDVSTLISAHILSRNLNSTCAHCTEQGTLVSSHINAFAPDCGGFYEDFKIGLSGDGRLWLWDPASVDVAMYIFER